MFAAQAPAHDSCLALACDLTLARFLHLLRVSVYMISGAQLWCDVSPNSEQHLLSQANMGLRSWMSAGASTEKQSLSIGALPPS